MILDIAPNAENPFERRTVIGFSKTLFHRGTVIWNGVEFEGAHEVRLSRERFEKRQELIASRKRPIKARNVSTCKHWLSGLIKCSICGATLSYTGNNACPDFQCWKYAKGFHKTSVALSVKKSRKKLLRLFIRFFPALSFPTSANLSPRIATISKLNGYKKSSPNWISGKNESQAYESEIDTLEEYKANKERLTASRLKLNSQIENLLHDQGRT